jgi:hypothetical protein
MEERRQERKKMHSNYRDASREDTSFSRRGHESDRHVSESQRIDGHNNQRRAGERKERINDKNGLQSVDDDNYYLIKQSLSPQPIATGGSDAMESSQRWTSYFLRIAEMALNANVIASADFLSSRIAIINSVRLSQATLGWFD